MTGAVTWGKLNQVIMLLIFVRFNINLIGPLFLFGKLTFVQWIYAVRIYNFDQMITLPDYLILYK